MTIQQGNWSAQYNSGKNSYVGALTITNVSSWPPNGTWPYGTGIGTGGPTGTGGIGGPYGPVGAPGITGPYGPLCPGTVGPNTITISPYLPSAEPSPEMIKAAEKLLADPEFEVGKFLARILAKHLEDNIDEYMKDEVVKKYLLKK